MNHLYYAYGLSKPLDRVTLKMHTHDTFEVFWFLNGDIDYIIEGQVFPLKPFEIIMIPPHVMHRAVQKSPSRYERLIINIGTEFFDQFDCPEYRKVMYRYNPKIDADLVFSSGLSGVLERLRSYTKNFSQNTDALYTSATLEILHLLSGIDNENEVTEENTIQAVIRYLNEHMPQKPCLDTLAEQVYLSKEHLCRIFKKATGYTIISYLNHIRINRALEFHKQGMTLSEACIQVGFGSYNHFYKAYYKEYGCSPRKKA